MFLIWIRGTVQEEKKVYGQCIPHNGHWTKSVNNLCSGAVKTSEYDHNLWHQKRRETEEHRQIKYTYEPRHEISNNLTF